MLAGSHNVLAIIPARAGSKRIPKKNFRPFASTTLVEIAIRQAIDSKLISDIVLSSDSKEVLAIGENFVRIECVQRPEEFATDDSPAIEYVRHALSVMEELRRTRYEIVVILQPSSPFRSPSDIDTTIKLLTIHPGADSAVTVVKVPHMANPVKMKTMKGSELLPFFENEHGRMTEKDLPEVYVRNCAVYVTWRKDLEKRVDIIGDRSMGYVMPANTSVDINEMIDFEFAEMLYKKRYS